MARKPLSEELIPPRERLWAAMRAEARKYGAFRLGTVAADARMTADCARDYLRGLLAAKLAEEVTPASPTTAATYRLLVTWSAAPRVNRAGEVVTAGLGVLAMWRTMKVRKRFSPGELARDATVGGLVVAHATARAYCQHLAAAGYLRVVSKGHGIGKGAVESVYQLVRDTGPHAPAITRAKAVFDRNTGQVQCVQSTQELLDQVEGAKA